MWDQSVILVTLRTDIVYDLDIKTGSGSVLVNVPEGVDFYNLDINTGSGGIDLDLNGSSNIANDLNLDTGSGSIESAKEFEYSKLRLDTGPFMTATRKVYKSTGFYEIEEYPEAEVPPIIIFDWFFMEKIL